jgi:hypothetical protein
MVCAARISPSALAESVRCRTGKVDAISAIDEPTMKTNRPEKHQADRRSRRCVSESGSFIGPADARDSGPGAAVKGPT